MTAVELRRSSKPDNAALREAIRLAQQDDGAAFEFLYRLHCRRVYALCLRMAKDGKTAEDLTQEAFLQLFRKIHTFRGEAAFSSRLHRLTANIARPNDSRVVEYFEPFPKDEKVRGRSRNG